MMKNKSIRMVLSVLAGILVIGGVYGIIQMGEKNTPPVMEEDAVDWADEENEDSVAVSVDEKIAIPGTDVINMKAGQKKQIVNLYNTGKNKCYFRISLLEEEGQLLYQSDLIAPGKGIREIELSKTLPKGTYPDAILKYECFDMDEDFTPLNGAEFALTIQSN